MARTHGTRSCYVGGCRRKECVDANRVYERSRPNRSKYPRKERPTLRDFTENEAAWLAGLLEGEGSFITLQLPDGRERPIISLQMTDQDVVERAAQIVGIGKVRSASPKNPKHQDTWQWTCGRSDIIIGLHARLIHYFGIRRTNAFNRCLTAAEKVQTRMQQWSNG